MKLGQIQLPEATIAFCIENPIEIILVFVNVKVNIIYYMVWGMFGIVRLSHKLNALDQ